MAQHQTFQLVGTEDLLPTHAVVFDIVPNLFDRISNGQAITRLGQIRSKQAEKNWPYWAADLM